MLVHDLFSLNDDFKGCKLLTGKNGLDKEIKKVEIMEVPDGAFWAKEGSMIITTGYSLKKNDITTGSLVEMLIEKKVAALGIKLGRYIDEIPEKVLEYADTNNFPIINLPLYLCYDQIITPINQKLMDAENYDIYIVNKLKRELRDLLRHNYNLESILNLLMLYTNKRAAIYLSSNFSFVAGNTSRCFKELSLKLSNNIKAIYLCENDKQITMGEKLFRVFKIETVNKILALLCIEEEDTNLFSNTDYEVVFELIPIITIYLLSNTELSLSESKGVGDLYFKFLMDDYSNNELKLKEDASLFNIEEERSRFCIILEADGRDNLEKISEKITYRLGKNENLVYYKIIKDKLVIICETLKNTTDSRYLEKLVVTYNEYLVTEFSFTSIFMGISNVCNSLIYLRYTYVEADFALKMGKRLNKGKSIFFYEDYMIYHLISEISAYPTIERIYKNTIIRIKKADEKYEQEYLTTLRAFVENDFSIGETAKALFIHRNTLYKRIEKINSIMNFDINKSGNRLIIQLALEIEKMIK